MSGVGEHNMDIPILFENDEVLAVNKSAGMVVHRDGRTIEENVSDWFLENYPNAHGVGEPLILGDGTVIERPGIVHRLDRETSGILLLPKTQESFLNIKEQFKGRTITKVYRAFLYGKLKSEKGVIDRPIGKSRRDFRMWSASRGARGEMREALTEYRVLASSEAFSYVEVTPRTGRTHQIRVHFKAVNYPVVCDKLYAPARECALGFARLALHAASLEWTLLSGEQQKVEAPLPADFTAAEAILTA